MLSLNTHIEDTHFTTYFLKNMVRISIKSGKFPLAEFKVTAFESELNI